MRRSSDWRETLEKHDRRLEALAEQRTSTKAVQWSDPAQWAEKCRILKGEPFSFKDRDYLLPIYRNTHPRTIIVKARQMEMTEYLVNWLLHNLTTFPNTVGIYTAPRADQVSRFSRDRLRRAIKDSPMLRHNLEVARAEEGKEAITRIPFANGSILYLVTAWGDFGAIRNIPSDFVTIDEIQDVQAEAIPVIEESMSHSEHRRMVIVGTASESGSEFDRLWQQSTMQEWNGTAWVPKKPENQRVSEGFHMTQEMGVWIKDLSPDDPNSIEAKRLRYSERRFLNEVLGLFYAGMAKPLLPEDMLRCRAFELSMMSRLNPPFRSYMGVDWGGGIGRTVVWIMALDEWDRWRLLYVHRFEETDLMKQAQVVSNLIPLFNVRQCVADLGYGAVQVSELQKKHAGTVLGCSYVQRPDKPLERKDREEFGERIVQFHVLADRSFYVEKAISLITLVDAKGNCFPMLQLPWAEPAKIEWIIDQFTCLEREQAELQSGRQYFRYLHPEGTEDHALHAFVYALIAYDATKMYGEFSMGPLFG